MDFSLIGRPKPYILRNDWTSKIASHLFLAVQKLRQPSPAGPFVRVPSYGMGTRGRPEDGVSVPRRPGNRGRRNVLSAE